MEQQKNWWEDAPIATNWWEDAPIAEMPTINDVPTAEGMTVGDETRKPKERSFGSEFGRNFDEVVGSRVGLDNPSAVHKYAGVFTPIVDAAAMVGDTIMGTGQGLAFGTGQGLFGNKKGRQFGRDLMGLSESAGIVTGVSPAAKLFGGVNKPRPKLPQNVKTLEDAGIKPSLAMATDSSSLRSLATGMENLPVVGSPLQRSADNALDAVTDSSGKLIRQIGTPTDDVGVGQTVRGGLERYATSADEGADLGLPSRQTSIPSKAKALYDKAGIEETLDILPSNTRSAISPVVSKYSDEVLSKVFKNTNMGKIAEQLNSGAKLSYGDLKQLRRDVWKMKKQQDVTTSIDDVDVNNLYNAITRDLEAMAQSQGKLKEFRRAEDFWSKSQTRIDTVLKRFAGKNMSDEQIYNRILQSAKEGSTGNIKSLTSLRQSLRPEEWNEVSATVLNRLGTKNDAFNANSFITNYNKLSPQARDLLTSNTPELKSAFNNLADATTLLQRYNRARPTGSAPMQSTLGTAYVGMGVIESFLTGSLPIMSTIGATIGAGTSALLSSPRFVRLVARTQDLKHKSRQGQDITVASQNLTRDLYLLAQSKDVAAGEVAKLMNTEEGNK